MSFGELKNSTKGASYYEFNNNERNGKVICRKIQETLICQATDFFLGKSYYAEEGRFPKCLRKLKELTKPFGDSSYGKYLKLLVNENQ